MLLTNEFIVRSFVLILESSPARNVIHEHILEMRCIGVSDPVFKNTLESWTISGESAFALVGLFVFLSPKILINQIHLGTAPTWHQLIYGISIGTVAYTGIETISNMAEESSNPGRDVPKAVKFVLAAVLGVYFAISMVGLSAMTVHYNVLPVNPQTKIIQPVDVLPAPGKHQRLKI